MNEYKCPCGLTDCRIVMVPQPYGKGIIEDALKEGDSLLREDKTEKPDFSYLGEMYYAVARIMQRLMMGEKKYARRNWVNCEDELTYQQSAIRHLLQYIEGNTEEDHLAAAGANILILLDLEEGKNNEVF